MRIELVNTGSELLLGQVRNSHLEFVAERLFTLGLRLQRQCCVPDGEAIADVLGEAMGRCDILIVTGGLGPTDDDKTREAAAGLLGLPMHPDEKVHEAIRRRFAARGIPLDDHILRQTMVPEGAIVLANPNGTAPGLHLPPGQATASPRIFLLPGPPRELAPMFDEQVMPVLEAAGATGARPQCRILRLSGIGESQVESRVGLLLEKIAELETGYCARPGEVDVRLVGPAKAVDAGSVAVRKAFPDAVFTESAETMEEVVVAMLRQAGATLSTAESCTGGQLASRLTDVPGASACFAGGFVTYSNTMKREALGVPATLLEQCGSVSEEVATAMALGAQSRCASDFALATTGIAGPGGGTAKNPVGTVWIALACHNGECLAQKWRFHTDRSTFKLMASQTALNMLRRRMSSVMG